MGHCYNSLWELARGPGQLVGMTRAVWEAPSLPMEITQIMGKSSSLCLCLVITHTQRRKNLKNPENDALTRLGS